MRPTHIWEHFVLQYKMMLNQCSVFRINYLLNTFTLFSLYTFLLRTLVRNLMLFIIPLLIFPDIKVNC